MALILILSTPVSAQLVGVVSTHLGVPSPPSWGSADAWLQCNTSFPGTTLTPTILAACTVGGVPPITTLGYTTIPNGATTSSDIQLASPFVTGTTGNSTTYTVQSVTFRAGGGGTTANFDVGIYSDSSNAPGSRICHSGTTNLAVSSFSETTINVSGCGTLAASTQYWIAYITDSGTLQQERDPVNCTGSLSTVSGTGPVSALLPGSFGTPTATGQCYGWWANITGTNGDLVWTLQPSTGFTGFAIQASQGTLGGTITVQGTTYPANSTTKSMGLDDVESLTGVFAGGGATSAFSSLNISTLVANGYLTVGPPAGTSLWDYVSLYDVSGGYVIMQLANGAGICGTSYVMQIETNVSGTTHSASCIALTPGHRYSYSLLFDETGGTAKLAMYDPSSSFAQVGSTITCAQKTGNTFVKWFLGNNEAGSSTGTSYFEDSMLDWTNHTFPNWPH